MGMNPRFRNRFLVDFSQPRNRFFVDSVFQIRKPEILEIPFAVPQDWNPLFAMIFFNWWSFHGDESLLEKSISCRFFTASKSIFRRFHFSDPPAWNPKILTWGPLDWNPLFTMIFSNWWCFQYSHPHAEEVFWTKVYAKRKMFVCVLFFQSWNQGRDRDPENWDFSSFPFSTLSRVLTTSKKRHRKTNSKDQGEKILSPTTLN